ncbi:MULTISPECIES: hypothetical protein [Halorussus]|uniref:hypothetical protein n=1 Tax=Halorussus TaxID=1070314 RepID=UPI000E20D737|nr:MULTISPECIES: hypothetical protein [Halorussus]NHN59453.1 hypothetical protein [Halorussus sp. JP-T4]
MSDVVTPRTVGAAIALAVLGIVFNTTRLELTGTALLTWAVASVALAFLLVHGVKYLRLNTVR